ncbi:hypothetical protein TNCT_164661 [Trichonephila clavata]|uniref:Uncharacterized protein n=1 Tax=Trichonephila clavata TaxID=2740835 RepID=A0A8X6KQC9_TRICU|nr:hypothetical protein TNCT_164661 [Trichonephila clavata]
MKFCHCLPLAKIKIMTKRGEFYTEAAIKQDSCDFDMYLLGNRTAELIEASEQGVQLINAVVTRSKGIYPSLEGGKEASDGGFERAPGETCGIRFPVRRGGKRQP